MNDTPKDTMPRAHFESLEALERTYWWHVNRRKIALALLRPLRLNAPALLDLGCGTGGFLEQISRTLAARRAVGVDASSSAVEFSREKRIEIVRSDLSAPVRIAEGVFDIVTAMDVLEHLPDEAPLLESATVNLRPGGLFLASVPALPRLYSSWDKQLGHHRRYTRPMLKSVISKAGFEIVTCSYAFSYALIPALIRRMGGKDYTASSCVFPPMSQAADGLLKVCGTIEASLIRHAPPPIGLSLFILAQKPGGD